MAQHSAGDMRGIARRSEKYLRIMLSITHSPFGAYEQGILHVLARLKDLSRYIRKNYLLRKRKLLGDKLCSIYVYGREEPRIDLLHKQYQIL